MYLLDTNILRNLFLRVPSPALLARLAITPSDQQFTSPITVGELIYGARKAVDRQEHWIEQIETRVLPNVHVLTVDQAAAYRYAEVRAELERRGMPLDEADLRIAAVALAQNLILVTGNVRHFQRVPNLRVENWLA
jgi:tRNA(fMet)-specific endonuclease VapC